MWIKGVLGLFSFIGMAFTSKHQAVHDSLTRTTVQVRDRARAQPEDILAERLPEPDAVIPSPARRLAIILVYGVLATLLGSLIAVVGLSNECAVRSICTSGDSLVLNGASLLWLASIVAVIILGWKGRLWGARTGV